MDVERITLTPRTVLGVRQQHVRPDAMSEFFGRAMETAYQALQKAGLAPTGPPIAVYRGDPEQGFDVTAGFPIAGPVDAPSGVELMELPSGQAVSTVHTGSYDAMTETYARIGTWMEDQHLTPREPMWEEYLSDPSENPDPATWRTRIVFPVE
jgi:effector-binding domain-containing protein